MSFFDRQQGMQQGSWDTARSYGAAINQWEAHAKRLEEKLRAATQNAEEQEKQRLFALATVEGRTALAQVFKDELARVCPTSPLLRKDVRQDIHGAAMAQFLKQHGYDYDPQTEMVKKA